EIRRSWPTCSQPSVIACVASAIRSTPTPSTGSRPLRPPKRIGAMKSLTSSISPASKKAPARWGPPSSRSEEISRLPSWSSAERGTAAQGRPDPDGHGVAAGPPVMRPGAALLAGDPLRVAGAGRDLPVERHRRLEQHPRPPGPRVLAKRLVCQSRAADEVGVGDEHLDPVVAEDPEPPA